MHLMLSFHNICVLYIANCLKLDILYVVLLACEYSCMSCTYVFPVATRFVIYIEMSQQPSPFIFTVLKDVINELQYRKQTS